MQSTMEQMNPVKENYPLPKNEKTIKILLREIKEKMAKNSSQPVPDNFLDKIDELLECDEDEQNGWRQKNIKALKTLSKTDPNSAEDKKQAYAIIDKTVKDREAFNIFVKEVKKVVEFLNKNIKEIDTVAAVQINDIDLRADIISSINRAKGKLTELTAVIRHSDSQMIRDSDLQEKFRHFQNQVIAPIKCALEQLGRGGQKKRRDLLLKFAHKIIGDCHTFNSYLDHCLNNPKFLSSELEGFSKYSQLIT